MTEISLAKVSESPDRRHERVEAFGNVFDDRNFAGLCAHQLRKLHAHALDRVEQRLLVYAAFDARVEIGIHRAAGCLRN